MWSDSPVYLTMQQEIKETPRPKSNSLECLKLNSRENNLKHRDPV